MTLTAKSQGFNASNLKNSDFFYHVITTIKSLAQQSRHELTLKAITEGWFLRRKRSFSRTYLAKATGLHKDTISTHNIFWEKTGILQIERIYHEINSYGHKFIGVLGEIFGYVKPMEYRSTSLLTSSNKYIINHGNKMEEFGLNFENKSEISSFSGNVSNPGCFCPPSLCEGAQAVSLAASTEKVEQVKTQDLRLQKKIEYIVTPKIVKPQFAQWIIDKIKAR
jgi:hypothetical protein